jgi:hypothetical protein
VSYTFISICKKSTIIGSRSNSEHRMLYITSGSRTARQHAATITTQIHILCSFLFRTTKGGTNGRTNGGCIIYRTHARSTCPLSNSSNPLLRSSCSKLGNNSLGAFDIKLRDVSELFAASPSLNTRELLASNITFRSDKVDRDFMSKSLATPVDCASISTPGLVCMSTHVRV